MREFSLFQRFAVLCTALLVVLMVLTAPAFAQAITGFGAVSGTVLDASAAPVPGAKVVVFNPSLGLNREETTTDGGIFVAPELVPAQGYKVSVSKVGFAPYATAEFEVHVGETVNLKGGAGRRRGHPDRGDNRRRARGR